MIEVGRGKSETKSSGETKNCLSQGEREIK